ncbi:MAG: DUF5671 domain-containing protein [Patescibacteria group bacterium]
MEEKIETYVLAGDKKNLPRNVFLHLFAMVALYWSAISFITLCWQYVNYYLPDIAVERYGQYYSLGPIRFAIASLIIIFPLFVLATWFLNKIYRKESFVRESKTRKWLIYLTLFIASLVVVGDLIFVINTFLGGEITLRFVLKAFSVLLVAIAVFGYYLDDVRRPEPSKSAKLYAIAGGVLVLAMVIGAFFIVGSPAKARLAQLDQQRVNDLQSIQYQVVNYWQRKGQLPENLAVLGDPISGYIVPNDPATSQPYEYNVKSAENLTFELCAVFSLSLHGNGDGRPKPVPAYDGFNQNWNHSQGRTCFERTIDKQLYPRLENLPVK